MIFIITSINGNWLQKLNIFNLCKKKKSAADFINGINDLKLNAVLF